MNWLKDEDLYQNRYGITALLVVLFFISFFYFLGTEEYMYRVYDHSSDIIQVSENIKNEMANINCSIDHDGCHKDSLNLNTTTLNVKTFEGEK